MQHLTPEVKDGSKCAVTYSAGNYGKAFAHCLSKKALKGLVLMPHTAPDDRVEMIKVRVGLNVQSLKYPFFKYSEM